MSKTDRKRRRRHRVRLAVCAAVLAAAAFATALFLLSGVTLDRDPFALAKVRLQPFAGSIGAVEAFTTDRTRVALRIRKGRLIPQGKLQPGEAITIDVAVHRPGWSSWLLGAERRVQLRVRAPVAHVVKRWLTVPQGRAPHVRFDMPVSIVSLGGKTVSAHSATVALPAHSIAGSIAVAAAARPWETLGPAVSVTWFPAATRPVVLANPEAGGKIGPLSRLQLTFSLPVSSLFGTRTPALSPHVSGRWRLTDPHTLTFEPSGYGAPFATTETVRFPTALDVVGRTRTTRRVSRTVAWTVASASFLRLQQLLAQEGYLPVAWTPSSSDVRRTTAAEIRSATAAPAGRFRPRYPNTPRELVSLWKTGGPNQIMRGAVMTFEHDHQLAVDGIAGPQVWRAAIEDGIGGRRRLDGYSYVYVHRKVPQLLTLWHNGHTVLTSPGNTGVPAAPTQLGTWPVFEHIPTGTMSGVNPDGSRYHDPGIRWISYFHGGEALHAFNRASFGTPQSLGCVELPLSEAAKVWPYTPIGTLVTIEN